MTHSQTLTNRRKKQRTRKDLAGVVKHAKSLTKVKKVTTPKVKAPKVKKVKTPNVDKVKTPKVKKVPVPAMNTPNVKKVSAPATGKKDSSKGLKK